MAQTDLDFSLRTTPPSWTEASKDAPVGDSRPLKPRRHLRLVPIREGADLFTASITGGAMAFILGSAYYVYEVRDQLSSVFIAPIIGMLIAVAVRLGAGVREPGARATLSAALYILCLFVTIYFVERSQYRAIYDHPPDLRAVSRAITRDRLRDVATALSWAAGLGAAIMTSHILHSSRR